MESLLKIRTLENLLEENPAPQHGWVQVGLLGPRGPKLGCAGCFGIPGGVVSCWTLTATLYLLHDTGSIPYEKEMTFVG